MPAQLTYTDEMAIGFPGLLADSGFTDKLSKFNAEATDEIPFGFCVAQGTGFDAAILPVDATSHLIGVVIHSQSYGPDQLGDTGVKPDQPLSVLNRGRIYVTVETAVAPGDPAYTRIAASGAGAVNGSWRNNDDEFRATRVRGAQFRTAATAGGIAVLEVDFNVTAAVAGLT